MPSLEAQARREAQRLESLWRIVNSPRLHGDELVIAMLREAATSIRPGIDYGASLGHVEGPDFVIDAIGGRFAIGEDAARLTLPTGLRLKRPTSLSVRDLDAGRTQSWDDCQALEDCPARTRASGLRAQIMTQFLAAGKTYVLALGTRSPPSGTGFGPEDYGYIELLGSFFAREIELEEVQLSLIAAEWSARRHSERLQTLWQVANNPTLSGAELILAMLQQGAAEIRPPQRFRGQLGRIEGDSLLVVAIGSPAGSGDMRPTRLQIGQRKPLAPAIVPRAGRTQGWEDLAALDEPPTAVAMLGWRAIVSTRFDAAGSEYVLTFASTEPTGLPFSDEDLAYVDALGSSFAKQMEVDHLAESLRTQEEIARDHALRLEGLWKIANDPTLHDNELLLAMLAEVATAIRPGQRYRGMLWRVSGTDMILEALAHGDRSFGKSPDALGDVLPLATSIVGRALAGNMATHAWDDLRASGEMSAHAEANGTRSLVLRTFTAGARTWALLFASTEPAATPLEPQDHAYIEVVSAFFANHVQQRWQFERIAYQQSHDVLTGLLNRSQFRSQARSSARTSTHYAIVLVDVDAFREINESYGHMIGDALLVEVANALRLRALNEEVVGRIGDDVFGIYIPNPESKEFVLSRVLSFAEAFSRGFSTGDRNGKEFIARTAGLGVAVAPDDGTLIDAILDHADAALVRAKQRGHGSIVFYESGMEGDAHRRTALRNEIAEAVAENQFELYYQPHVEISSGQITGCEALIRWNHPTRGLVMPQHFIPFAEQSGIITSIDSWVMQSAFAAANDLGSSHPDFRLYFNLSGRQAGDSKLIRSFVKAARAGVSLEHVGVEITETDAMRDVEATRHVCRALRRLNVKIAIDDFGTGYSSLSSLKQLPVDIVKIDRSFVSGVMTDPHDATIADTIITIAARFGFESLAEGVEQLGEIDFLRQRPCRYMQGYAICHPLPLDAFKRWLTDYTT